MLGLDLSKDKSQHWGGEGRGMECNLITVEQERAV